MGYIINKEGQRIQVDNPDGWCAENVVIINDDTILVDKWAVDLYKRDMWANSDESNFVKEIMFDKEPTDEQLIFHMSQNGINRASGYVSVQKVKALDYRR
jgi:hypothetical protein